jgi:hypothetical protein
MPTYLYTCPIHGKFEEEHSIKIKLDFCSKCTEEGKLDVPVERLINCVTKGVVELSGQELIARAKQEGKQLAKDAAKSEKIYSNLLGEGRYNDLQTRMDRRKR